MTHKTRVTIREVALAAGVSTQTVSRVVNKRLDVAPETFERVQKVIDKLGYVPNALVRSLIQGRSHSLGVVAFGLDYFGPLRTLIGIEKQAKELGYSILLNLLHEPGVDDVDKTFRSMLGNQVDGIIWAVPEIGANRGWAEAKSLDFPIPIVFARGMTRPTSFPIVEINNRSIGQCAAEHLIAGGARHFGIITGPSDWWEAQERLNGWRETLRAHALDVEDRLVVEGDWSAKSGEQGLYQLIAHCPDIDAVFAGNDQMALGVLHAAYRLGRRVPQELSVVGVDNMPESAHFSPPLTTVRQRLQEAGAQAVSQLDLLIQGTDKPRQIVPGVTLIEPELIIRESSRLAARPQS